MSSQNNPGSQAYPPVFRQTSETINPSNSSEIQYPATLPHSQARYDKRPPPVEPVRMLVPAGNLPHSQNGYENGPLPVEQWLIRVPQPARHSRSDGNYTNFRLAHEMQYQMGPQPMVGANPLVRDILINQHPSNPRRRLVYAPPEDRIPLSLEEKATINAHGNLDQDIHMEEMAVRSGTGYVNITTNAYIQVYNRRRMEIRDDFIDGMNSIKREKSDLMFRHTMEDQQMLQQQNLGRLHRPRLTVHRQMNTAELHYISASRAQLRRYEFSHLEKKKQRFENEYHERVKELENDRLSWDPRVAVEGQLH